MTTEENIHSEIEKGSLWVKKHPTTAFVEEVTPAQFNIEGKQIKTGTVRFTNDAGSLCVMTISQFNEMYKQYESEEE